MSFLDLAKKRYSCRKISARPVEDEKLQKILEAGDLAPTAHNNQPFHIWLLESAEAMQKVSQTTSFIFGAPVAFVVGSKAESAWVRPFDKKNFADVDASIAATHIMLAIEDLGLGTTWVAHFDAPKLKELFPEMADYELVAIFPVGYPAEDAAPSPRHTERVGVAALSDRL
ncbi:nitroreductase family protein [Selenomonas sp.]|uniref:nitroreductase family protein n=1 Tax=Selenomonas sp. TaxID=2053611 RepID=UPI003FA2F21A